jgi:hypothetical protein
MGYVAFYLQVGVETLVEIVAEFSREATRVVERLPHGCLGEEVGVVAAVHAEHNTNAQHARIMLERRL